MLFLGMAGMNFALAEDSAREALDAARRFAKEGKFEEALERHLWFHHHALEHRPSYYGVRLSFALADWMELGRRYPKALEALRQVRDEKTARLAGGEQDRALFHDVESINDHLKEPRATVDLFRKVEAAQPEFAVVVADLAAKSFVDAEEYALARKYLGDPADAFSRAEKQLARGLAYAKSSRRPAAAQDAFESIFTGEVVRIVTVLDRTGSPDLAREVQTKALAVLDRPEIHEALSSKAPPPR